MGFLHLVHTKIHVLHFHKFSKSRLDFKLRLQLGFRICVEADIITEFKHTYTAIGNKYDKNKCSAARQTVRSLMFMLSSTNSRNVQALVAVWSKYVALSATP